VRLLGSEGAFSYYHPKHVFTGFSWDALSAAGLLTSKPIGDVVVLGLGGGTCARQCRALYPDAHIVGIEVDKNILALARREFHLDPLDLEVILDSGQHFMRTTRRRFDLIIDDMWPEEPFKPKVIMAERTWIETIQTRLRTGGVYTINLYDRDEHSEEMANVYSIVRRRFANVLEVRPPHGQTTTIAASDSSLSPRFARSRVASFPRSHALHLNQLAYCDLSNHSMKG